MKTTKIEKALKKADELIEKAEVISESPVNSLKIESILSNINPILSEKAKKVFNELRVDSQMKLNENGDVEWVARFFGTQTSTRSAGALKIAHIINDLVEKYNILGVLGDPIQLELNSTYSIGSLVYFAVSPSDAIKLEEHELNFRKGQSPIVSLESLEELQEAAKYGLDKLDIIGF